MKKKLFIVGISFIVLICFQIFSSGHGHVVVVEDNIQLTGENKKLTKQNTMLKGKVTQLTEKNEELKETTETLQTQVEQVTEDLNVTTQDLKKVTKELKHEKSIVSAISSGDDYNFSPISLPVTDSIQRR